MKRTNIDFSKHKVTVQNLDGVLIHSIKLEDSYINSVKFINTSGIMAVTGDFGYWIFCREFHPSKDGKVSDHYWCEKLKIASSQEPYEYDQEATEKELKNKIEHPEEELTEEVEEYYKNLLDYYAHEIGEIYLSKAHETLPHGWDHESVIYCEKIKFWLEAIFDAFEEICNREGK